MLQDPVYVGLKMLVGAIEGAGPNTGPGTGSYPLSHAVSDIANALHAYSPHDEELCDAIAHAGEQIKEGLEAVARAIRGSAPE